MDSRRLSCSFIARAASSISAKVFGGIGAVCEMTAFSTESTLSTALQHGQVTSKAGTVFAIQFNDIAIYGSWGFSLMGSTLNKYSISHPKRKTENATTTMARVSPKL